MLKINDRIYELYLQKDTNQMSWEDISNIILNEFNEYVSAEGCRHRVSRIRESLDKPATNVIQEYAPLVEARDNLAQANAIYKRLSREESIKDIALVAAEAIAEKKPFLSTDPCRLLSSEASDSALLIISDWHYGICINNYVNVYNPDICVDRVKECTNEVLHKIDQLRIKTLYVLNLGDMIAGNIHLQIRIQSRTDVITQTMEVSELIAEMLQKFSDKVYVKYFQVLDNHSRIDPNKKESLQLESLARITHWYLKDRFKDRPDVEINDNTIDEDIAYFEIADDFTVAGVHGDKDKKENIIPKLNLFIKDQINLICSAHMHHFSADEDNRTFLISNGSLMGTDDYAFQKRLDSSPSQTFVTFKATEYGTEVDGIYKLNSQIYS